MNGSGRSWHHAQCGHAARADRHESGRTVLVDAEDCFSPSAMPATPNASGCRQVPRLPRKTATSADQRITRATPAASATPATQTHGRSYQVPRLPRQMPLDVAKCHACHAKRRPARTSASQEPPQPQVPRLPRKRKVYLTKCHGVCAKDHGITGDQRGPSASQEPAQCHKCPDLTKCDNGSMSRSATPATPSAAATTASIGNQVRHQSQPSAINATRATPATPKTEISPGKPGCKKAVYSSLSCWRPGRS